MMDTLFDLGKATLAAQPFSRLVGAELTRCSEEGIEIRLKIRDELRQQYGFVHGGVLSYLADNALTFAGGISLQNQVVTSEMKLNYIRPAIGAELISRAKSISCGRTQAVVRCEIYSVEDGVERLCAAAQGTIAVAGNRNAS